MRKSRLLKNGPRDFFIDNIYLIMFSKYFSLSSLSLSRLDIYASVSADTLVHSLSHDSHILIPTPIGQMSERTGISREQALEDSFTSSF